MHEAGAQALADAEFTVDLHVPVADAVLAHGAHAELASAMDHVRDARQAVEKAVLAMAMQVDELGRHDGLSATRSRRKRTAPKAHAQRRSIGG